MLPDGRLLVGNDNNYPGSTDRVCGTPDDTELIILGFGAAPVVSVPDTSVAETSAPASSVPPFVQA